MAEIQQQRYFETTRQFKCPSCGGELQLFNKRTRYVGCTYCGAQLDATHDLAVRINKLDAPSSQPPLSFVKVGMEALIANVRYVVLGRIRWEMDYYEYWSEEDEAGWDKEKWEYDEWLLLSENRNLLYLIEDKEGFSVARTFLPKTPVLPGSYSDRISLVGGTGRLIQEYGTAKAIYHEGESTYQFRRGDVSHFASFKEGKYGHSIEWRKGNGGEILEIEFFEEEDLPAKVIKAAFGLSGKGEGEKPLSHDERRQQSSRALNRSRGVQFLGQMLFLTGLIMLCMFFYNEFSYRVVSSNSIPFSVTAQGRINGHRPAVGSTGVPFVLAQYKPAEPTNAPAGKPNQVPPQNQNTPQRNNNATQNTTHGNSAPTLSRVFTNDQGERFSYVGNMEFDIEQTGSAYELYIALHDIPDNTELFIGAEVLDADGLPQCAIEGDFYRASGSDYECDEDGCGNYDWTEEDLNRTLVFLPDTSGHYELRIWASGSMGISGTAEVALHEVKVSRYWGIGSLILLVVGGLTWSIGKARRKRVEAYGY